MVTLPETHIAQGSELDLLARDIAVFTQDGLYMAAEIYPNYSLKRADWDALERNRAFQERVAWHRSQIGSDTALLRERSRLMFMARLRDVHDIAADPDAKQADRLKAMAFLAEMADVKPKSDAAGSGITVNLSFGSLTPHAQVQHDIIEHTDIPDGTD